MVVTAPPAPSAPSSSVAVRFGDRDFTGDGLLEGRFRFMPREDAARRPPAAEQRFAAPKTHSARSARKAAVEYTLPPPVELQSDTALDEIRAELTALLWNRLPFAPLSAEFEYETDELIELYNNSLSQLHAFCDEFKALILAVCRTNVDFRHEQGPLLAKFRDRAIKQTAVEMARKAKFEIMPPKNVLSVDAVAQPPSVLWRHLHKSLRSELARLVQSMFAVFERMVDSHAAGLIEWKGENLCRYHFFRRVIIQRSGRTREVNETLHDNPDASPHGPQLIRTVTEQTTGRHTYRIARHEHHVNNAFCTSVGDTRVIVPIAVEQMLRQVPEWLRGFVCIVDGTLFRETIVERQYRTEQVVEKTTRDEPVFSLDPAVVIGPIILTGWGPREIDAELARRKEAGGGRSTSVASTDRWTYNAWTAVALCSHTLSVVFSARVTAGQPALAGLAAVFFVFGTVGVVQMLKARCRMCRIAVTLGHIVSAGVALTALPAAVHAAIAAVATGSVRLGLLGLGLSAVTALFGMFAYPALGRTLGRSTLPG